MTEEKSTRKRASRYIRPEKLRPMRLTERDKWVVKAVNDFRVMRQDQVQRLFFPSRNTAQVRLRLLWEHGFLRRDFLPTLGGIQTSPVLYMLDRRGADLLKREFGYDETALRWSPRKKPSSLFLAHMLGLSEVRLAVELSCWQHEYDLAIWRDEKAIKADYDRVKVGKDWVAVLPDAYFVTGIPTGKLHFFLEFDRGSEGLRVFNRKIAGYLAYWRSGKCRSRFGTDKIRVLTVTEGGVTGTGKTRLANLKESAEKLGARSRFWFCRLAEVAGEDFFSDPIWQVATSTKLTPLVST